jgi:hypothetical protein
VFAKENTDFKELLQGQELVVHLCNPS